VSAKGPSEIIIDSSSPPDKAETATSWTLTLRAEPGDMRPAIIRLRQLLKLAKRGFHLHCVGIVPAVEEVTP
jgi:hypothetical protein